MSKICLSKHMLGEKHHLIQDSRQGKFFWTDTVPDDTWTYGDPWSDSSIEELAWGICRDLPSWPPLAQKQAMTSLVGSERLSLIPWARVMPKRVFKESLQDTLIKLWDIVESEAAVTYGPVCLRAQKLLLGFRKASIDQVAWRVFRDKEASVGGQVDVIESFRSKDGRAEQALYSRKTHTGRATIEAGPKILRLKREMRSILKSEQTEGKIWIADYSSVEPRVMLSTAALLSDLELPDDREDVYEHVAKSVPGNLGRAEVKIVVMGILFGIGIPKLREVLGTRCDAVSAMSEIKDYFRVKKLQNELVRQFEKDRCIQTAYGRILKPPRSDASGLLSYYVQGTGADLSFEGFYDICKYLEERNADVSSLFSIHDALIFDAHTQTAEYLLKESLAAGERSTKLPGIFPLEMKTI